MESKLKVYYVYSSFVQGYARQTRTSKTRPKGFGRDSGKKNLKINRTGENLMGFSPIGYTKFEV